jgi:uncharacterized protein YjiS (DUF1127 family)
MLRTLSPTMASVPQTSGTSLLALARTQLGRAIRTIDVWIDRSRQRRALGDIARFDDHLMRDIGVTRDAAQREAAKLFWR